MSRPNRVEFVAALQRAFRTFLRAVADLTLPVDLRFAFWTEANRIQTLLNRNGGVEA